MQQIQLNFNIPWAKGENYWLCVVLQEENQAQHLIKEFKNTDLRGVVTGSHTIAFAAPKYWAHTWQRVNMALANHLLVNAKVAILPRKMGVPSEEEIILSSESTDKIDAIAENFWLADALYNHKLECYYQPVVDRTGRAYGYESFARLMLDDGALITGNKIIEGARKMNIEHVVDKYLHMLSMQTFAEAGLSGNLFINFITGFIQLPQKYLEKLTDAAKQNNINPKRIVLDVPTSWIQDDMAQLASIVDYCHSIGCSVALDDVDNSHLLANILQVTSPDYVKLDRKFSKYHQQPSVMKELEKIIKLSHSKGAMIIAEAVEDQEAFQLMQKLDVDLFQGYHFAAPQSIDKIIKAKTA